VAVSVKRAVPWDVMSCSQVHVYHFYKDPCSGMSEILQNFFQTVRYRKSVCEDGSMLLQDLLCLQATV